MSVISVLSILLDVGILHNVTLNRTAETNIHILGETKFKGLQYKHWDWCYRGAEGVSDFEYDGSDE